MLGLTFGISVFLVLGNESSTQADTTNFDTEEITQKNNAAVTTQAIHKSVVSNLDHAEPIKADETGDLISYTVKSGDNLSKISKEYYGDPNQYNKIFEANRPLLKNEDDIFPGQVLRIPQ